MGDSVSKTSTQIGFFLLGLICLIVGGGAILLLGIFFAVGAIPIWLKALVFIGVAGAVLLIFAVVRQRIVESKTDKYKDIEI